MIQQRGSSARIETGVRNLDTVLCGGLPRRSVSVFSGPPGSGKTILAQQLCFHAASREARVLYFNTLSEPTAKTLRYLKPFAFFDQAKLENDFEFVDLGVILRGDGLRECAALIMDRVKKTQPSIVVVDSFKVFEDLASSKEELRKFGYELAIHLMAWDVTALLLGEYSPADYTTNPLFSVVDGLVVLSQREASGDQQRFVQVLKMRGTDHDRQEHAFEITDQGISIFASRIAIVREPPDPGVPAAPRCKTGIDRFDDLLGDGIPRGSSLLVAGVAGTGKTVLSLEFVYRGALAGEKGVLFSFEETPDRLLATAHGMGWDLERQIERGMAELVFIPQPQIAVERDLLMMREKVKSFGAARVAIDSISVFLHKVRDAQVIREKVFQIASIVQNAGAVGLLATDIPYGSSQLSRYGVEETVVDGVVLLTSTEEGADRQRYVEVYKLRNTAHLKGRHSMLIARGGIQVYPRYSDANAAAPPPAVAIDERQPSGIPGLDARLGGGLLRRSATLVAGSAGIGKTTFGVQFVLEGAKRKEPGILFTLEEGPEQLMASADALGLPLRAAVADGLVELVYLSRPTVRATQLHSVLGDKVRERKARRLVIDGITNLTHEGPPDELGQTLYKLVRSVKELDATCVLTLETPSLHSADEVTGHGFSPLADNILMLRYALGPDAELRPVVTVVKTRGSAHDLGTFDLRFGEGGLRVEAGKAATARRKK